jgi:hypothetical protein
MGIGMFKHSSIYLLLSIKYNNKTDQISKTCGFPFKTVPNTFHDCPLVCPCHRNVGLLQVPSNCRDTYYHAMATHHFFRHNRPLPIVQILNDGSFLYFVWSDGNNTSQAQYMTLGLNQARPILA